MTAVFRREMGAYFHGVTGYLFMAFVLVFAGIYTMVYNLSGLYANFEYVLDAISFIYLIAVPVLTMRSLAEEKRQRTDQLLYSLPIRLVDVVAGKYLAMLTVLAAPTAVMGLYPLLLSRFGSVYLPTAYASLLAFFLLGAALLAIGLFISSVSESQVGSAVVCLATMLLLFFLPSLASYVPTTPSASLVALMVLAVLVSSVVYRLTRNSLFGMGLLIVLAGGLFAWFGADEAAFAGLFASILDALSVFNRFYPFINGIFDFTSVVYYLSLCGVFLFLAVQALEKRRWSE